jgi:Uma2 family endonuclease
MNVAVRRPMTVEQFLAWEERQPTKYEFDGFVPVAMVGVTNAHSAIQVNLMVALGTMLRGKACRPHGSDLKVRVAGRIRYPDAMVVCTPLDPDATVVTDPVVVVEILSPSSEHTDLVVKHTEYRSAPSIQHYVILEQTHAGALVFSRKGDDWISETVVGADAALLLPAIGLTIKLAEIYADVPLTVSVTEDQPA